jgi:amidase
MPQPSKTKKRKTSWQTIAQQAQEYRDASISEIQPSIPDLPPTLPKNVLHIPATILSEAEINITESSPEDLVSALAKGALTAREVTSAFLRRAALAQRLVRRRHVLYGLR